MALQLTIMILLVHYYGATGNVFQIQFIRPSLPVIKIISDNINTYWSVRF